jgi:short-subunit dehydrogenase
MHVLITGASSGIGEALAIAWSRRGASVTLCARRKSELQRVANQLSHAHIEVCDLAQLDNLANLVASAEASLGPVDVLVNNAGMEKVAPTLEIDLQLSEKLMTLNLFAPLRLTRAVLPGMLDRGRGAVVDISSVAAFAPPPFTTYYSASKAGLARASALLGAEVRPKGVQVLTVYPGPIHTELGQRAQDAYAQNWTHKLLPWGRPDQLAHRILSALDRNRTELVYPRPYVVAKWFPGLASLVMGMAPQPLR